MKPSARSRLLLNADRDEVALSCHPPQVRLRSVGVTPDVIEAARHSLADTVFVEARRRLGARLGEKPHTIVGQQDPKHGINLAAQQWSADLIVLGARGLNVFERLLLGSVSRAVVHASPIPVWIARPWRNGAGVAPRVLLASESPPAARRLADSLTHLNWPAGASFKVLTVIASIFAGRVPDWLEQQARSPEVEAMVEAWVREHDEDLRKSVDGLRELVAGLPAPLSSAQTVVLEGDPAHLITTAAAREHCELVVVGTRQKWSLATALLGGVCEAVLSHAPSSVLVVPRLEAPSRHFIAALLRRVRAESIRSPPGSSVADMSIRRLARRRKRSSR